MHINVSKKAFIIVAISNLLESLKRGKIYGRKEVNFLAKKGVTQTDGVLCVTNRKTSKYHKRSNDKPMSALQAWPELALCHCRFWRSFEVLYVRT
jgi:hypothetical protein